MKLNIDTKNKLIHIQENVNLGEFFTQLEELLPDGKWREYTIEANVEYWSPIQITPPHVPYNPLDPYKKIYVTSSTK